VEYADYPRHVAGEIVHLWRRIDASGIPAKVLDRNLIIGTWNIRHFGRVHESWEENPGSPKRNLRAMAHIAEIVRRFDVLAIQEVKRDTAAIRMLVERFLGPDWGLLISDVSAGAGGNHERLGFVYDSRRVQPSGLAGEVVLPPVKEGDPANQFARTPYIVGFESAGEGFSLLTAHIIYGQPSERREELKALAGHIAEEIRDRATAVSEERNLIVLGDFNIDKRGDNPLFQAFVSTGLYVPWELRDLRSTYGTEAKHYDQIAWFMGYMDLLYCEAAGTIDFTDAVMRELTLQQASYRLSDHFPLWAEFSVDRRASSMAQTLGVDASMPDPFGTVIDQS
jgi:endonuclease/exonuclease/phosphatase family metal-dependent hydrolase